MLTVFITAEDLIALTGKVQGAAQIRALNRMGIEHRVRPDGIPVVLLTAVDSSVGTKAKEPTPSEPNWDALRKY